MVDFNKRVSGKKATKPVDPIALYDTLDRAHDKGPLRPAQIAVLTDWFTKHQDTRDVIVKLHTGQGKTLIGLMMLQARLNAGKGPALYSAGSEFHATSPPTRRCRRSLRRTWNSRALGPTPISPTRSAMRSFQFPIGRG